MTVLPVITRELRAQSRLGFTYLLRVIGAATLLAVCVVFWANHSFAPRMGGMLFGYLHFVLNLSIWILTPLISADCISCERREGTVGLLFLTPLKAREVVLAKGLVHGVRALTLWLAVLPVMTITFLIGGVTWKEATMSMLMNFSSICWALAAGLLASSVTKTWLRAMALALALAFCMGVVFVTFTGWGTFLSIHRDSRFSLPFQNLGWSWQDREHYLQTLMVTGFFGVTGLGGWWGQMFGALSRSSQRAWMLAGAETAVFAVLLLMAAVLGAAWNLRRSWQEEPPSAGRVWLEQKLCEPVIGVKFFHRWLRRKLEHNPIGWLEQRTWSGRIVTWAWLAVMVSFYSVVFSAQYAFRLLEGVQLLMAWALMGIMAASAAGSFQRERESRVLELLLVSPMSVGQIISGRLRGLWGQFLPAMVLLVALWIYLGESLLQHNDMRGVPFFCGAFITVPLIGLYYSLKRKHFITAFLSTLLMGLVIPYVLKWMISLFAEIFLGFGLEYFSGMDDGLNDHSLTAGLYDSLRRTVASPFFVNVIQLIIAYRVGRQLHDMMVRREFAFSKSAN